MAINDKPLVSNLSMAFRRAVKITEDVVEAKKEHRQHLKVLIDKYMEDVPNGRAEGIRTAKELAEIIKLDLLLMGEATERNDNNNKFDDVVISRIASTIDTNDPAVQGLMENVLMVLNQANDEVDESSVAVDIEEEMFDDKDESEG